jgi:probable HAF family extracellular repeat protein
LPHGFVYSNGSYTPISDPLGTNGTAVTGINNQGQIVGYYLDSSNVQHGYIYSGGTYITVDAPLGDHGTVVTGINDAGQIVGYYLDNSGAPTPYLVALVQTAT